MVNPMSKQQVIKITREQEKEIINILIDSSLYLGMSLADRLDLMHYLVLIYFDLPIENRRARTTAMQTEPVM